MLATNVFYYVARPHTPRITLILETDSVHWILPEIAVTDKILINKPRGFSLKLK